MNRRLVVLSLLGALAAAGTGVATATPPDPQGRCITIGAPMVGGQQVGEPHTVCIPRPIQAG